MLDEIWLSAVRSAAAAAGHSGTGLVRDMRTASGMSIAYLEALFVILKPNAARPDDVAKELCRAWATPGRPLPDWQRLLNPEPNHPHVQNP